MQFANFMALSRVHSPFIHPKNTFQLFIRLATLSFIVLAVAGLRVNYMGTGTESDYALAVDVSSSMSSTDLLPTRLEAAKEAGKEFVKTVPSETEIGIVSFSGTSFVEQTMTNDKSILTQKVDDLSISVVGGTDIGEALISSANLLMSSDHSKTIILMTDGKSNIGVSVPRAIDYINQNEIQIFTMGIGTEEGGSPDGVNVTLKLDQELLERVATLTSGKYFHITDTEEMKQAYLSIIKETKRKITINLTVALMFLALSTSFFDWVLLNTKYRRIP